MSETPKCIRVCSECGPLPCNHFTASGDLIRFRRVGAEIEVIDDDPKALEGEIIGRILAHSFIRELGGE